MARPPRIDIPGALCKAKGRTRPFLRCQDTILLSMPIRVRIAPWCDRPRTAPGIALTPYRRGRILTNSLLRAAHPAESRLLKAGANFELLSFDDFS